MGHTLDMSLPCGWHTQQRSWWGGRARRDLVRDGRDHQRDARRWRLLGRGGVMDWKSRGWHLATRQEVPLEVTNQVK